MTLEELQAAEAGLASIEAYEALETLAEEYADEQQGLTPDAAWNSFRNALENAQFALNNNRFGTEDLTALAERLQNAADGLLYVESIEVVQLPAVTEYYVGDAFDPSGLAVEAVDNKGNRYTLTDQDYTLSGYELADVPYNSGFAGYKDWFIQNFRKPGFTIEAGLAPVTISQFDQIYRNVLGILVTAATGLPE